MSPVLLCRIPKPRVKAREKGEEREEREAFRRDARARASEVEQNKTEKKLTRERKKACGVPGEVISEVSLAREVTH